LSEEEEEEEAEKGERRGGARVGERESSGVLRGSVLRGAQGYVWDQYGAAADMGSKDATYTMAATFALNGRYTLKP